MKRYKPLFEMSASLQTIFKTGDQVKAWLETLNVPERKPKNISKVEHDAMLSFIDLLKDPMITSDKAFLNAMLLKKLPQLRLAKEEYEEVYKQQKDQPKVIKGKFATYHKEDAGSYDRFLKNIDDLERFFSSLKGYHKLALKKLSVTFVSSRKMKAKARYKDGSLLVNPLRVGNTKEEYGSLRYVILHELGHKFLKENKQSWDITAPSLYTTPYSKTNLNTMNEEEVFAELFALSNWKSKYKEYASQIKMFEKRLEY